MRKTIYVALLALFISFAAASQNTSSEYKTAIGVKFYPGAISIKSFIGDNKALEGLGSFFVYGFRFTGLYEIHGDINGVDGLKWYVGPGAHIGSWNNAWEKTYPSRPTGVNIGVDGVLGLDYKVNGIPLNFSLDWQPSFNIVGYNYFEGGWGGLGIRYTLN